MLCKYSKSKDITAKVKITYTFASPLWLLYSKFPYRVNYKNAPW